MFPGVLYINNQATSCVLEGKDDGVGVAGIGLMEDYLQIIVEILEYHRMATIFFEYRFRIASPRTFYLAGNGTGDCHTVFAILE